jgi:peptidyl-prolyl cis-trans isomerase A (cyclophilin A)
LMLEDDAPIAVANFLGYVNRGDYTGTFLHRSIPDFVLQGGGYRYDPDNNSAPHIITQAPIVNEFKISNTRGTVAMAKVGGDPNSATSEWFVNLANNAANLDSQNGGFTVFGVVINNGMTVVDEIAALPRQNFQGTFTDTPTINFSGSITAGIFVTLDSITVTVPSDFDGDGITDDIDSDDDNDGEPDTTDAFAFDDTETSDLDGDGIGDNADADDDNDGVADTEDAFPSDADEWADTDGDGIGDNADADDDNDGVADTEDAFPQDASEWADTDGDGIGDNQDLDNIGSYLGRAYHMTASTSPNLSEVHIINTSDVAQSFTGTLFHKSGSQLGDSDVGLHEGIIEPQGRLILASSDLEQRFNELPWTGPAMLDVRSSDQFELMTKLSRNGRVTNTNCVRTGNVHNVEGDDSADVTYIRFINDGSAALSNIRGTLYDTNGDPIGEPDAQLFDELGPREAIFLSRGSISNIFGDTWTGVASLVLSDTYENLKLMNLNFVNDETFFNFSCFEKANDTSEVTGQAFFISNISDQVVQGVCLECHSEDGLAKASALVYAPSSTSGHETTNFNLLQSYIDADADNANTILEKVRGASARLAGLDRAADNYRFRRA